MIPKEIEEKWNKASRIVDDPLTLGSIYYAMEVFCDDNVDVLVDKIQDIIAQMDESKVLFLQIIEYLKPHKDDL